MSDEVPPPDNGFDPVQLFALGGLGEIGMNCLALKAGGRVVLIDCGVTFPNPAHGANLIHPSFEALEDPGLELAGLVLTHGHEDHLGAVPYLLRRWNLPVWGPAYPLALLRERLQEHDLSDAELNVVKTGEAFSVGPFRCETIRVTHSIADATALVVETGAGTIVHSGDFKIDQMPTDGEHFDEPRFRELGNAGVALLLSDSTNAFVDGVSGSESSVHEGLQSRIAGFEQAVVVSLFSSNLHRLRSLFRIARDTDRRVLALGRSLRRHISVGVDTGYLKDVDPLLIAPREAKRLPRERLLVLATGSQGEGRAALARMTRGQHSDFSLESGDRVILSSRIIPGHENSVYRLVNDLTRRGAEVVFAKHTKGLHVSGHACREEQAALIRMLRPRCFVPVHGTLIHLRAHAELASSLDVPQVLTVENGALLELDQDGVREVGRVPSGRVHVDNNFAEVSSDTLQDRQVLGEVGFATAVLSCADDGAFTGRVRVVMRGALADPDDHELGDRAEEYVEAALGSIDPFEVADVLEQEAEQALARFFRRELGRRPLCCGVLAS